MIRYLIFGLVFLMVGSFPAMGCNIIKAKTQVEKVPVPKIEDFKVIQTAKPILCADEKAILKHLDRIGEQPMLTWSDDNHGYPVVLFVNVKSGSISVIEIPRLATSPALDKAPFKGLVCFPSTGSNAKMTLPGNKRGIKAKFMPYGG